MMATATNPLAEGTHMTDVRVYKTRDSATSALRKLGIKPRDYSYFLSRNDDGTIECRLGDAQKHLNSLAAAKPATATKPTAPTPAPTPVVESSPAADEPSKPSANCATTIRQLILAGHTNKEIWAAVQGPFGLDENKRHYPSWYRSEMKRKGLLNDQS